MFKYCYHLTEEVAGKVPEKSSVTAKDVPRARGRQRRVYSGATDDESAQLSSLTPSATCHALPSLRSSGNLRLFDFAKHPYYFSIKTSLLLFHQIRSVSPDEAKKSPE